jgi:hypothetical protein
LQIIKDVICPNIYRLLSDMLPASGDGEESNDRQAFVSKLTKCWSDCAGVVVVDHRLLVSEPPYMMSTRVLMAIGLVDVYRTIWAAILGEAGE